MCALEGLVLPVCATSDCCGHLAFPSPLQSFALPPLISLSSSLPISIPYLFFPLPNPSPPSPHSSATPIPPLFVTPPLPFPSPSPVCRSESCGNIHYTGKTGKLGVVPFYYDPAEQEVEFGDHVQFMIAKVKRTKEQRAVEIKIIQRQRDIRFKVRQADNPATCVVLSVSCFSQCLLQQ